MTTASDNHQQPAKRTRFEAPSESKATTSPTEPPKSLAESFIKSNVATLQPQLAIIVEKLGKEHILLLSKKDNVKRTHQRMIDNEDFIPRSARIQFDLKGSKRAIELPEYKQLAEETSDLVADFTKNLKTQIIKAAAIEIKAAENELRYHLSKCVRIITSAFLINKNDTSNVDSTVYKLAQRFLDDISINCTMNLATFEKIYKEVHTIETFPPSGATATENATAPTENEEMIDDANDSTVSPFFRNRRATSTTTATTTTTTTIVNTPPPEDDITTLKTIIEKVFVTSWFMFKQQQQKNKVTLELKKLATAYFTEKKTADAVLPVDSEPAADKKELKALIRLETLSETKNLSKQLEVLQKELASLKAKNIQPRGRGGASSNKTNTTPSTTKPSPKKRKPSKARSNNNNTNHQNQNKNERVGANNNARGNGKRNSNPKPGKPQSKKKNSTSNRVPRRVSNRSDRK
jgi:hypothetical protein